jgi:hypothetical protein
MLNEHGDILLALAERGKFQGEPIDAEEEVLPEFSLLHQLGQVPVGGGDEAHNHINRLAGAEGTDLTLLKCPQQLRLHGK